MEFIESTTRYPGARLSAESVIRFAMKAGRNRELRELCMKNARAWPESKSVFTAMARLHNSYVVSYKRMARGVL